MAEFRRRRAWPRRGAANGVEFPHPRDRGRRGSPRWLGLPAELGRMGRLGAEHRLGLSRRGFQHGIGIPRRRRASRGGSGHWYGQGRRRRRGPHRRGCGRGGRGYHLPPESMGMVDDRVRTEAAPTWLPGLIAAVGAERVLTDLPQRREFGTDRWHAAALPDVVVEAHSRDEVVATLRYAHEQGIPVTTRGAGVGYVGGCVPVQGGILLSVRKMNRLLELNPADGVAVVEPGLILDELQQAARKIGWYYPPDPASLKECSVGGTLATNAGGPRCVKYGVTRHYVLGLEVVLPDGQVLRTGGRCHKNKTGLDL